MFNRLLTFVSIAGYATTVLDHPQKATEELGLRNPPRSDPYYQKIDALADLGAHRTYVHVVEDVPRVYEGRCPECDWHGSETTGTKALQEMLAHTESTHPLRDRWSPIIRVSAEARGGLC